MFVKLPVPNIERNQVGHVHVTLTVTNHVDQILAERGFISVDEIRSITLEDVLVDTGASLLCLPTAMIEVLGLPVKGKTTMKTAAGMRQSNIFKEANLMLGDRQGTFDCLELQDIEVPLLGVLPLESLGLEPDLQNQRLKVLPNDEEDTYIYAM